MCCALLAGIAVASQPPDATATVQVDLLSNSLVPLPHTWKRCFGSGHAALGLRDDWFAQLKMAKDRIGLEGIRQHGLLDDDMGVVVGYRSYNFTLIDKLWDRLTSLRLKPIVELSFMPSLLANCSWFGPGIGACHSNTTAPCSNIRKGCDAGQGKLKPGCRACKTGMRYSGVEEHPVDFDDWRHLVQSVAAHAVDRFGLSEVQQWKWEVWNELWGFGDTTPACKRPPCIGISYMSLYNASAVAIKAVHSSLQVGGPSTEHLNVENFLSQAQEMGAPVDFVSTHNYPTGPRGDGSGCPQRKDWEPDCFVKDVLAARASVPASVPFVLSEYSVMVGRGMAASDSVASSGDSPSVHQSVGGLSQGHDPRGEPPMQHDTSGAAAFIFRVVPQLSSHGASDASTDGAQDTGGGAPLAALSYWTFSDVFEENGLPETEFFDILKGQPHYGAITLHGVPKPVWRAFELLHLHAGSYLLPTQIVNSSCTAFNGSGIPLPLLSAAATANLSSASLAGDHAVDPSSVRLFLSHWDASDDEAVTQTMHANISVTVQVSSVGALASGTDTKVTAWVIDASVQARDEWRKMGSPKVLTAEQLDSLKRVSQILPRSISWTRTSVNNNDAAFDIVLPPNSAAVIQLQ